MGEGGGEREGDLFMGSLLSLSLFLSFFLWNPSVGI